MLSRVADSLYWLGRYGERVETNTHILATQLEYMLEHSARDRHVVDLCKKIVAICGYDEDFKARYEEITQETLIHYVLCDDKNYNAILPLIHNIRDNARNTRDIIPNELWEVWNELYLNLPSCKPNMSVLSTMEQLMSVRKTSLSAAGVIDSLMTRDEGFLFLKIGKWLERSEKTALIISHLLESSASDLQREIAIDHALKLTNSQDDYLRRHRKLNRMDILNFLVSDLKSTRSVAYGIRKMKATIVDIENGEKRAYSAQLFDALDELEQLVQTDAHALTYEERLNWIHTIRLKCTQLGPIFAKTYYLTPPILVDSEALMQFS